ncbi:ceramide kinase [Gracilinanus agilis]|uniref:ceramide kinase n=1 Tax=Gracilinanus agilis TaxID=191870 RepID=UPI001CFE52FD|nr:ceramide kinase [Gracilinanus agilis]
MTHVPPRGPLTTEGSGPLPGTPPPGPALVARARALLAWEERDGDSGCETGERSAAGPGPGAAMEAEPGPPQLWLKRRRCFLSLDRPRALLAWGPCSDPVPDPSPDRPPAPTPASGPGAYSVPVSEIITVEETEIDKKDHKSGKWQKMAKPYAFTVYYVKRAQKTCRWRCGHVTFWCTDEVLCNQWIQTLRDLIKSLTCRPKHLLVYINPFGGKRQAKRVYEQKIVPLFNLASITTEVIVTEHANHAKDSLFEINIEKYDGIICVGGDGMFSEVLHGLIGRTQRDYGIDQNDPKASLVQCNLRIGIIPAGGVAMWLAAPSVGDVRSQKPRWAASLGAGPSESVALPGAGCAAMSCFDISEEVEEWKMIHGKFLAINATNMSCACPRSPKGLSPMAHLADGSLDLILVRKCSRLNFLRYLVRHTNEDDQFDFTFVEVYRVRKFQFMSKHSEDEDGDLKDLRKKRFGPICSKHQSCCCSLPSSTWNCDGEILNNSAIEVRVHCQLVQLFARGIEETPKQEALS